MHRAPYTRAARNGQRLSPVLGAQDSSLGFDKRERHGNRTPCPPRPAPCGFLPGKLIPGKPSREAEAGSRRPRPPGGAVRSRRARVPKVTCAGPALPVFEKSKHQTGLNRQERESEERAERGGRAWRPQRPDGTAPAPSVAVLRCCAPRPALCRGGKGSNPGHASEQEGRAFAVALPKHNAGYWKSEERFQIQVEAF